MDETRDVGFATARFRRPPPRRRRPRVPRPVRELALPVLAILVFMTGAFFGSLRVAEAMWHPTDEVPVVVVTVRPPAKVHYRFVTPPAQYAPAPAPVSPHRRHHAPPPPAPSPQPPDPSPSPPATPSPAPSPTGPAPTPSQSSIPVPTTSPPPPSGPPPSSPPASPPPTPSSVPAPTITSVPVPCLPCSASPSAPAGHILSARYGNDHQERGDWKGTDCRAETAGGKRCRISLILP